METLSKPAVQDPSDAALIQQFKQGSKEAFDLLYHRYLPGVYKRVRYVVPESDIEDVTQEVFIAVMQSLPNFRGDAQFSTWLRTLTNHKVAEFYRKRGRKQEPLLASLSEASAKTAGGSAGALEERIFLQRSLQNLPENYREIILLRFAEEMQFNEIAELTGQNLEAVKSLFRRAVAALKNQLDE